MSTLKILVYDHRELLLSAVKWLERIVLRRDMLPGSFFDGSDPEPLVRAIRQTLKENANAIAAAPPAPAAQQAVPSYQQAYEANCALVTALDRIRDIIDGKAPASDMGIHEIVNRALELHRLAAPPAPSSEQPKETT